MRSPYSTLRERLVANTAEPENDRACWVWTAKRDRHGYGRLNVYVPGLGKAATLMAHIALWVWDEAGCRSADDLWLAYQEFVNSGLELDHLCRVRSCANADHLLPATPVENCARRVRVSTYAMML